ncbi:response regulator [Lachnospiraceae bacterium]|nr:response regulator [Lachnospiraceae bacterium]
MTIFIVDDEAWITIGLKKLIEKSALPFEVIGEAKDGITALEEIRLLNPDIVFTDIRMPGMTGLELLGQITDDPSLTAKVVIISGYADFEYARTAMRKGSCDYLLKPIKQEDLNNILNKLYDAHTPSETENKGPLSKEDLFSQPSLQSILEEMKLDYNKDISLTKLAKKYGISPGYLSMQIKQELGISFSEFITTKRMQKAKELLQNETFSVSEVATAVGYHDYFYFTKAFKKMLGISPSKYRKDLKRNDSEHA